jgi:hypothetical protein
MNAIRMPGEINRHSTRPFLSISMPITAKEFTMRKYTYLFAVAAVFGFMSTALDSASAQSRDPLNIENNDSIYVDAKSFKVVQGRAQGDAAALIKKLDAMDLGPGAIIFRSGGKLYMVPPSRFGSDRDDRYGSDRDDRYGTDRDDRYGTDRDDRYASDRSGSRRYGTDRDDRYGTDRDDRYASDRSGSRRYGTDRDSRYGTDRDDRYGTDRDDRYGSDRANGRQSVYINDPAYAQYKLKKTFEDNWTTSDPK